MPKIVHPITTDTTQSENSATESREMLAIVAEIQEHQKDVETHFLEIGKLLNEAKGKIGHGKWLDWLRGNFEMSAITARRYMRLAEAFEKGSPVTALGFAKACIVLALKDNAEDFMQAAHKINDTSKKAVEMSKRELETAVRMFKRKINGERINIAGGSQIPPAQKEQADPADIFRISFEQMQDCVSKMLECLGELEESPATYGELSSALYQACEDTLKNITLDEQSAVA